MARVMVALILTLSFIPPAFAQRGGAKEDPPPVFDKRPYAEAQKAAEEGKKWFIVKATAVWCPPCKQMDRSTWRDEKVVAWLGEHAIAVAVDVDKEPQLAKELGIEAMPTMIAFRNGAEEFDRVVGYKGPEDFLDWLEGVHKGETARAKPARRRPAAKEGQDVQQRLSDARDLQRQRKFAEAADEYVWLWNHMLEHQPSMYGVRLSFMAGDMQRLAVASEVAREKFEALRDEAGKDIQNPRGDREQLRDWIALNRVLGQEERTLAWFDLVKAEPRWRAILQIQDPDLERLLIAEQRWADMGRLASEPLQKVNRRHEMLKMAEKSGARFGDEFAETQREMFRDTCATLYASLLAAERDDEAGEVAARAREIDPSIQMIRKLVETAITAGEPREEHLEWTEEEGRGLSRGTKAKLEAALKKKQGR